MNRDFDSVLIEYAKAGKKPVYCTIGDGERIPVPLEYASNVKAFSELLFQSEQKTKEYQKYNSSHAAHSCSVWRCKVGEFSAAIPLEDALHNVPVAESIQRVKKEALRRYTQAVRLSKMLQKEYPEEHFQITLDPQKLKKMARKHDVFGLREVTKAVSKAFDVPLMKAARAVVSQKGALTRAAAYFSEKKVKRVSSKSQSKKLISDKALRRLRMAALQALVVGAAFVTTWKLASLSKKSKKDSASILSAAVQNQPKAEVDTLAVNLQQIQGAELDSTAAVQRAAKAKQNIPVIKNTKTAPAVPLKPSGGLVPKDAHGVYAQNFQMAIDCHDEMVCLFAIYEGFRSKAYRCAAGYPTLGYGMRFISGRPVRMGDVTDRNKAVVDLTAFFDKYLFPRLQSVPRVLTKSELGTFTMFSGNLGLGAAVKSEFFKNFGSDNPNYEMMASQLGRHCGYRDENGIYRQSKGLKDRRAFEAYLLKSGDDIGYFFTLSTKMVGHVRENLRKYGNLDNYVASSVENSVLSRVPEELQERLIKKYDIRISADGKLVSNNPSGLTLSEKQARIKQDLLVDNLVNVPLPNQPLLSAQQKSIVLNTASKESSR